ncbi:MAG: hypothetical protein HOP13_20250 [Alphaproteobacteria bacterium]|nr:hypothetical protein [Alphaproteobacteria bacterium]
MRSSIAAIALVASALPAAAVQVRECDYAANIQTLAEPWEKNIRSFYKGQVRVALLDTGGEPVCCSMHLLIMMPSDDEPAEGRVCRIVGTKDQLGFEGIDMSRLRTSYDAKRGLLIEFPYTLYVDGLKHRSGAARVRVNVKQGTVKAE